MDPIKLSNIKRIILTILTALVTVLGVVGLGEYVPFVETLIESIEPLWAAILTIVAIIAEFIALKKPVDNATKGQMVRESMKGKMEAFSTKHERRKAFFNA